MVLDNLQFTLPEFLSLLGVVQCVYILVYMSFRAGMLSRAILPMLYFLFFGLAFLSDAAARFWSPVVSNYDVYQWLFWFSGPPLSVLIVVQIAQITRTPPLEYYFVLLLLPFAYIMANFLSLDATGCPTIPEDCDARQDWMLLSGILAGGVSLLTVWLGRSEMDALHQHKASHERFWLIMALIIMNAAFLGTMLAVLQDIISMDLAVLVRTFLGIGFVYIASTSLFRIYPQAVVMNPVRKDLSAEEMAIAEAVDRLMKMDKVYQETTYGRADMARELNITEGALSRIVNISYNKSFPQLLNEYRVEDAKHLLKETDLPARTIAEESGFNSVASFNRVFKELTNQSPTEYREAKK